MTFDRGASRLAEAQTASARFRRTFLLRRPLDRTMVITMVAVRVMQVPVDEIVNMIHMRHAFVTAPRAMHMGPIVSSAGMIGCALVPVRAVAFENVFVNVIAVQVMQMTIVQIVGMAVVPDRDVTAARSMCVSVMFVFLASFAGLLDSSLSHPSSSGRW
jgi:hypothetical protein